MHFIDAEDYHQDYLKKNPNGYCHIDVSQSQIPVIDVEHYQKPSDEELNQVQHFFINSHSIHDTLNAADFESYAMQQVESIFQKNDYAVIVA